MNTKKVIFLLAVLFGYSAHSQHYVAVDLGFQNIKTNSIESDFYEDGSIYFNEDHTPCELGLSYLRAHSRFQWQAGLHFRHFVGVVINSNFNPVMLPNTRFVRNGYAFNQLALPVSANYAIVKNSFIEIRPFAGLSLNRYMVAQGESRYLITPSREDDLAAPDVVYAIKKFYTKGGILSGESGIQVFGVYGIHFDFLIGKDSESKFRVSLMSAKGLTDGTKYDLYYENQGGEVVAGVQQGRHWHRMHYATLQFSYLHPINLNKKSSGTKL